jgi:hypothetical protein
MGVAMFFSSVDAFIIGWPGALGDPFQPVLASVTR